MKNAVCILVSFCGVLSAQVPNPTQRGVPNQSRESMPIYRVTVVARTAKAINYRHRSGATKIDFRGTALMPKAHGEAKVESKQGYIEIEVEFREISGPASQFGPEYLTYVMWAISPEGRSVNLGEVLLNGKNSKLNVSSDLQAFGLIVTAEPYFSVTQPSDVVVMENVVRADTKGKVDEIDAKYELLQRGQYVFNVDKSQLTTMTDRKIPLELYEARNAVQIARWTGADKYAAESYEKAVKLLKQAEDYQVRKQKKPVSMISREAVQTAEDARVIAIRRQEEERLAMERQAAADREAKAKAETEAEARRRAQAEAEQKAEAERRARAEAERATAQAAQQAAQTETERIRREAEAARLAAQAEAERIRRETDAARAAAQAEAERVKAAAMADAERAAREKAEAEAAQAAALAQQQAAQAEAEKARLAAQEAERLRQNAESEKTQLRSQLVRQLNTILETRDSARGLIVNMSDVLFDTGRYTLRAGAREKLAKVSGIILAHPGLRLEVEGHTDSVGGDEYNQRLSEQRAAAVRDYLTQQGISMNSVTAKGFGKTVPVASNDTPAGRQRNRRVELVVSGDVIGTPLGSAPTVPSSVR